MNTQNDKCTIKEFVMDAIRKANSRHVLKYGGEYNSVDINIMIVNTLTSLISSIPNYNAITESSIKYMLGLITASSSDKNIHTSDYLLSYQAYFYSLLLNQSLIHTEHNNSSNKDQEDTYSKKTITALIEYVIDISTTDAFVNFHIKYALRDMYEETSMSKKDKRTILLNNTYLVPILLIVLLLDVDDIRTCFNISNKESKKGR